MGTTKEKRTSQTNFVKHKAYFYPVSSGEISLSFIFNSDCVQKNLQKKIMLRSIQAFEGNVTADGSANFKVKIRRLRIEVMTEETWLSCKTPNSSTSNVTFASF